MLILIIRPLDRHAYQDQIRYRFFSGQIHYDGFCIPINVSNPRGCYQASNERLRAQRIFFEVSIYFYLAKKVDSWQLE